MGPQHAQREFRGNLVGETAVENVCRVFVVEDGSILCSGLCHALSGNNLIEVVGTEHDNWRILESIRRIAPDVVIMILATDTILARVRQVRDMAGESVAVLVIGDPEALDADSVAAGASGTISWRATATEVSLAIMAATTGTAELPSGFWSLRGEAQDRVRLSNREMEVMQRATEGLTNSSIARSLCLSEATVKTYWRRIFKKLDVHDRTKAVTIAMNMGILPSTVERSPRCTRTASSARA
jgi:DNA-binding NarL/FixJ family response regulator